MENDHLIMAIDIGTTSVKCMIINTTGKVIVSSSNAYSVINRHLNWVEQDPEEWWISTVKCINNCFKKIKKEEIKVISFSGQMSAPVFISERGKIVYPSILISDTRSSKQSTYLKNNFLNTFIQKTGNEPIDAFTVSKLLWIKEKHPKILKKIHKIIFPKDFIRYKLTGIVGTDPTDAGNSLLFDPTLDVWNWELISQLGLPSDIFPEVFNSNEVFGTINSEVSKLTGLLKGTPVVVGAADMACSQIGTAAFKNDTVAITLSTSCQIVMRTKEFSQEGIGKVTFHKSAIDNSFYTMGTVFTGGLGVEWSYKKIFNKQKMEEEDYEYLDYITDQIEKKPPGSEGVLFLPFLVGSSTPYYDSSDRAAWIGLTLNQGKALLLRSVLEGITYNIKESLITMESMNLNPQNIYLAAGGSKNKAWRQIIADIIGKNIFLLENKDSSALGAAILGGVGIGIFEDINGAVNQMVEVSEIVEVNKENHKIYNKLFEGYQNIYQNLNEYIHSYIKN